MIKDEIQKHKEKMCVTYALKNYYKFNQLEEEIRRNVKRELNGGNSIQFTSYDLRSFIGAFYKTHKLINKSINFSKFQKRFEKYEKITDKEMIEQTLKVCDYMACAREMQATYSLLNYDATLLF